MTTTDKPDIFTLLNKIRYDATAIQAKVSDALTMLANTTPPDANAPTHACPTCKVGFHSERRLDEHLANVHGALLPARAKPTTLPGSDGG